MAMNIKVKVLRDNAHLPTRGSDFAAGYDLYAATEDGKPVWIKPHETAKIGTGLSFELPSGTYAAIYARSGLATKQGLRPANCVGICDSDYRGEYIVAVHNDSEEVRTIISGDRIAQMILSPYYEMEFTEFENLSETKRGEGGFGSTDTIEGVLSSAT